MKEKSLEQNVSFENQPLLSYYKCRYEVFGYKFEMKSYIG